MDLSVPAGFISFLLSSFLLRRLMTSSLVLPVSSTIVEVHLLSSGLRFRLVATGVVGVVSMLMLMFLLFFL